MIFSAWYCYCLLILSSVYESLFIFLRLFSMRPFFNSRCCLKYTTSKEGSVFCPLQQYFVLPSILSHNVFEITPCSLSGQIGQWIGRWNGIKLHQVLDNQSCTFWRSPCSSVTNLVKYFQLQSKKAFSFRDVGVMLKMLQI